MEISDDLLCLYSVQIEFDGDSYVIEVPKRELQLGTLNEDDTYRVAITASEGEASEPVQADAEPQQADQAEPSPPVDEGDMREVEIESVGDQGDGVGKIDRGYVVIVPDTEPGDEVTVKMEVVKQRFAIGQVVGS